MDKEIKKEWVEALRSSKYKQCTGQLCKIDPETQEKSYCCLGVLCDLHSQKTGEQFVINQLGLPKTVSDWAGLEYLPEVNYYGYRTKLSHLNDGDGKNFEEIADIIEQDKLL